MVSALCVAGLGCGDGAKRIPDERQSGFSFRDDAFTFVNFADNAGGGALDSDLVARMFGPEHVCKNAATPCEPTAIAETWRRGVNQTLFEGRSEGFAVLAQLMSMGEIDPNDFGAPTAAELRLEGNLLLQRELAYWAALQNVPSALQGDLRFAAKDVMPFLAGALDPDNEERYRLALAVKTPSGFVRGHGLLPIGYHRVEDKVYRLRVYDNNFPRAERELVIDASANTWRYEAPLPSGETLVYEGTEDNGNLLYFSPIRQRLGTLQPPFGADASTSSLTSAGRIQVSASIGDSEAAGFENGAVVERGSGRMVPAFASCPLCKPSRGILNYTLRNALDEDLVVDITPGDNGDGEGSEGASQVSVTGPNFSTRVEGVDTDEGTQSTLTVEPDGDVTFSSDGDSDVTVSSTRVVGGNESRVNVVVEGGDGEAGTRTVNLTVDEDGRPTVDVTGLPEGSTVEVTYTVVNPETGESSASTVEVTVRDGATQLKIDPETGTVRSVDEICGNGMFDEAFELDTDCGDTCLSGCDVGQRCTEQSDCFDRGVTPTGDILCLDDGMEQLRCTEQSCDDGHKTGFETDVDCGSVNGAMSGCDPCTSSNAEQVAACDSNDDCGGGVCAGGGCRLKNGIAIDFTGMPVGGLRKFWATIDGQQYGYAQAVETEGDTRIELPDGYQYSIYVSQNATHSCFKRVDGQLVESARHEGHTGYDPDQPGVFDREIVLECQGSTGDLSLTSSGIPDGLEVPLNFTFDWRIASGQRIYDTRTITDNETVLLAQFSGNWTLALASQPGLVRIDDVQYYDECLLRHGTGAASTSVSGFMPLGGTDSVSLECARNTCPYNGHCEGRLFVDVTGLADGDYFRLYRLGTDAVPVQQNGRIADFDWAKNLSWTIIDQPGQKGEGQNKTYTECLWSDDSDSKLLSVGETDVFETITCTENACPYEDKCIGVLYVETSGLPAGGSVTVTDNGSFNITADGTTSLGARSGTRQLQVTAQPGERVVGMGKVYNECLFSNGFSIINVPVAGDDVTQTLTCTDHACPYDDHCSTALYVDVQGMPDGVSIDLRATLGGQQSTHSPTGSGTVELLDGAGDYTLEVVSQPGVVAVGGGEAHVACQWANMSTTTSGTLSGTEATLVLSCTATMCPHQLCVQACTLDSECGNDNCECGINSGNCTGDTGSCGRSKAVIDDPTTDGVTESGTFTVPTGCNEVFIQAWGAAGGSSDDGGLSGPGLGTPGGAGGYVSGTLSVAAGDEITVWIGQGGAPDDTGPGGTPGIGSNVGVEASGGFGDVDTFGGGAGGGGGGLTSIQQTGSVTRTILIPAGGGASSSDAGADVGTAGGGTEATSAGGDAAFGSVGGGGGAGEYGGAGSEFGEAGLPGSYSSLPADLTSTDPSVGEAPNNDVNDYASCLGVDGEANAGMSSTMAGGGAGNWGGDGCVVIRCVGM